MVKTDGCKNNSEKPSTTKASEHFLNEEVRRICRKIQLFRRKY